MTVFPRKPQIVRIAAGAAVAATLISLTGATAQAAGPVPIAGRLTTPALADPLPFPSASYTGDVDPAGQLTVRPDCVSGGLVPGAPCLPWQDLYLGISDRVLNWQNLSAHTAGSVDAGWDGTFVANPGPGQITFQILKPINGVGMAVGGYFN